MKSLPGNFNLKKVASELAPNVIILDELIGSTESEFLFVGEKLQDFHQRASDVASMTTEAVRHIAGTEVGSIIENFKIVLAMAENLSGGFVTEKDNLKNIIVCFSNIRFPLIMFEKVVRNLTVLCNFIKIEIARLGRSDTGFNSLADEVRRLASVIGIKTTELVSKTDFLTPMLLENLSLVENLGSKNEEQAKMIMQKIVQNIEILTQKTNISADSIKDIAQKWGKISASTAEVVESMQFHDITRQRFEHARDALKELPQKISNHRKEHSGRYYLHRLLKINSGNGASKIKYEEVDLVADTCEMQKAQLLHARDGFVDAVERILESLKNIAGLAVSMSAEIYEVTGSGNDMKGSFVLELEKDIGYLEDCVSECTRLNKDLSTAMREVAQTASGMTVFMKEMEKISIEMQMLALNARIHAAHMGDQGETLGVLADSIHQIAIETATQVGFITVNLKDAVANAERMTTKADQDNLLVQDKACKIKDNLEQIIEPIKKIEDELKLLLPRIEQAGNMLAGDIADLTSRVTIHNRIDDDIEKVVACLNNISAKVRGNKTAGSSHSRKSHLDDLALRYTMHTERETHLKAAKRDQADKPLKITASPSGLQPAAGDEMGDNVELF